MKRKRTKGTDTDDTKLTVTHHDRVRRSPFPVKELTCIDKIDIRFKGTVEPILPTLQRGQNGQVACAQLIPTGTENVCKLSFIDKDSHLALTHGKLSPHHDLFTVHVILVDDRIFCVVGPFNNIDQLTLDYIENTHLFSSILLSILFIHLCM